MKNGCETKGDTDKNGASENDAVQLLVIVIPRAGRTQSSALVCVSLSLGAKSSSEIYGMTMRVAGVEKVSPSVMKSPGFSANLLEVESC